MIAAFIFPAATAYIIGQLLVLVLGINIPAKSFTAVLALRAMVPAGRALVGLQNITHNSFKDFLEVCY